MAKMKVGGEKGEWSERDTSASCVKRTGTRRRGR